jgi:hypothetical protein
MQEVAMQLSGRVIRRLSFPFFLIFNFFPQNARTHLNGRIHCRQNLKLIALSSFQCLVRDCELVVGGRKKARVGGVGSRWGWCW